MYCNINDIAKQLPIRELQQKVDDENRGAQVNMSDPDDVAVHRLNQIIESSSVEIDGYIAGKYQLPLVTVPSRLVDICVDLTIYNLARRRILEVPDAILALYKRRIDELKMIQRGEILLPINSVGEATISGFAIVTNKDEIDKVFTDSLLGKY